jgi:hypothetical protein
VPGVYALGVCASGVCAPAVCAPGVCAPAVRAPGRLVVEQRLDRRSPTDPHRRPTHPRTIGVGRWALHELSGDECDHHDSDLAFAYVYLQKSSNRHRQDASILLRLLSFASCD